MNHLEALVQAKWAFDHKAGSDSYTRRLRAQELADFGIFSNAQIARFTGRKPHLVAGLSGKTDRKGGRLTGESLEHLIAYLEADARGERDLSAIRSAYAAGASQGMIARLVGLSQMEIWRRCRGMSADA